MNTIAAALSSAEVELARAGIDTARLDAEVLLAAALGTGRSGLFARLRDPLDDAVGRGFESLLARRRAREPVAHILGGREFWSLWFEVAPATLVPRPETEILVESALEMLAAVARPTILDAGTGSGCIAVALACERRDARVTAIDISEAALAVAGRNAERHGVAERIEFVRADLAGFAPGAGFDLLVSNPPYIPRGDIERLEPEVSRWEPRGALDGGEDGLRLIAALLQRAPALLNPGGGLAVEIGAGQADAALALARAAGFAAARVRPDYAGIARVLLAPLSPADGPTP